MRRLTRWRVANRDHANGTKEKRYFRKREVPPIAHGTTKNEYGKGLDF